VNETLIISSNTLPASPSEPVYVGDIYSMPGCVVREDEGYLYQESSTLSILWMWNKTALPAVFSDWS
jgi:hypothetical protein